LEAQVASDVGVHAAHGFEGVGNERDEGLERNARAIMSTRDIKDKEWRDAREKDGRPVGLGSKEISAV
jgi:hypothetical protein